jgi:GntR family transcriptional repressor for pyruvate dehydrogenase complex
MRILDVPDSLAGMVADKAGGPPSAARETKRTTLPFDVPRRASRAETAAEAIERRIVEDRLAPGASLGTRRELGELLSVAPSTVSEVIKLLEDRGRVVTRTGPGGGVFVAEPDVRVRLARSMMSLSGSGGEVVDALEVRDILESAVIINAAQAAHDRQQLKGMLQAMRALQRAHDTADYYARNLEFHSEVAALCGNEILRSMYQSLLELVRAHDPKLEILPGLDRSKLHTRRTQVHQAIADAIANGDVGAARASARLHARHGRATVIRDAR